MSSGISRQLRTEPLSPLPPLPGCSPRTDHSLKPGNRLHTARSALLKAGVLRGDLTQPGMCSGGARLGAGCLFAWRGGVGGGGGGDLNCLTSSCIFLLLPSPPSVALSVE